MYAICNVIITIINIKEKSSLFNDLYYNVSGKRKKLKQKSYVGVEGEESPRYGEFKGMDFLERKVGKGKVI